VIGGDAKKKERHVGEGGRRATLPRGGVCDFGSPSREGGLYVLRGERIEQHADKEIARTTFFREGIVGKESLQWGCFKLS